MSRFVKLDSDGRPLPADATQWAAVHDVPAGLIWSAENIGDGMQHAEAEKAVAAMTLCGEPARLPTVDELFALADRSRSEPAIDTAFFPTTESDWYWSSSAYVGSSVCAWFVSFDGGGSVWGRRDDRACVRAVRSVSAPAAGQ